MPTLAAPLDTSPVGLPAISARLRGNVDDIKTTIDNAGRIVIPKGMRSSLGLRGGDEVEIELDEGRIEMTPAPRQVHLAEGPHGVLVADLELPDVGTEEIRDAIERERR